MSHENELGTNDRAPNAMSFDHASYNLHPIILCRIIRNDIRTRWTLVGEYTLSSFVLEMHETCNTFELWGGVLGGSGGAATDRLQRRLLHYEILGLGDRRRPREERMTLASRFKSKNDCCHPPGMPRELYLNKSVADLMSARNQLIFFFVSWLIAISLCVIEKLHARNRRSADPLMPWHLFCALFVNKDIKELSDGRAELLKDQSNRSTNADVSTPALVEPTRTEYLWPKTAQQLHYFDVLKDMRKQGHAQNNNTVSRITRGWGCLCGHPWPPSDRVGGRTPIRTGVPHWFLIGGLAHYDYLRPHVLFGDGITHVSFNQQ